MVAEKRKEIRLTPEQLLAANLAALGIAPGSLTAPEKSSERIFNAYVAATREAKRAVTATEVGRRLGMTNSRVSLVAKNLEADGRMSRMIDKGSGKIVYIPLVKRASG